MARAIWNDPDGIVLAIVGLTVVIAPLVALAAQVSATHLGIF